MIEVVSIPEKPDRLMQGTELITYLWLIIFAIISDYNLLSIIISLALTAFYIFRSKYTTASVSIKACCLGLLSFLTLQFWLKCNDLTIIDHGMEIDRTTLIEFSFLTLALTLILSVIKEERGNHLRLLNQKTANK